MRKEIVELAKSKSAIDAINKGLIRCGFELEFHSCNDSNDEAEIDYERLDDAARDSIEDDDILTELENSNTSVYNIVSGLHEEGVAVGEAASCFNGLRLRNLVADAVSDAIDCAMETAREYVLSDRANEFYQRVDCRDHVNIPSDLSDEIEYVSDSSVRGGELRTIGGLTPSRFVAVANEIFEENTFEIDSGCSFHIHLSVPNVKHEYGETMQKEMQLYLLENFHRLPESVRSRTYSGAFEQYAPFSIRNRKYSAVSFHDSGKTWEFRLFGNVSNISEARKCLLLAIDSIRHAYGVKARITKPLAPALNHASMSELLNHAREGKSLRSISRKSINSVGA